MAQKTYKYVLEVIIDEDSDEPTGWIEQAIVESLESGEDFSLTLVNDNIEQ